MDLESPVVLVRYQIKQGQLSSYMFVFLSDDFIFYMKVSKHRVPVFVRVC